MIPAAIFESLGLPVTEYHPVQGGDINQCYCINADGARYFLKMHPHLSSPLLFEKEIHGLKELARSGRLKVPGPLKQGITGGSQYLLLEWLDAAPPRQHSWEQLGKGLAQLHRKTQSGFGFFENNYLGVWPQENTAAGTWPEFYADRRILPLIRTLFDLGKLTRADLANAEKFCKQLPGLFPGEPPALLHGDLWSGNVLFLADGTPAIFDPAVYYGHREMDIGMTLLFGGFDSGFYHAYRQTYPLQPGWQQRVPCTQLYPLLLHARLFGGHYTGNVKRILASFS
ncbi:fructosamine kinase family protein [Niabella aurantiaca]|uniref:fructosamine kinase family protein n=1 Tax=Niabella aurantiaca TaxID=379900 RepID=UPI00036A3F2D|nr:fructosamine kinase family protein [Niabella aurantiaca]